MTDDLDVTDDLDDRLRNELRSAFGSPSSAAGTLRELGPALKRARRRQRLQTNLASVAVVAVTAIGGTAVIQDLGDRRSMEVVAAGATDDGERREDRPAVAGSATTVQPSTRSSTDSSETSVPGSSTAALVPEESTSLTSGTSSTSGPAVTSSASATSTPAQPGGTARPQGAIQSACGSIVVVVDGSGIMLVDTIPNAGFAVDEKNGGPESVAVSFEGPGGHCEIEAQVRNGRLWTDISNESSTDAD